MAELTGNTATDTSTNSETQTSINQDNSVLDMSDEEFTKASDNGELNTNTNKDTEDTTTNETTDNEVSSAAPENAEKDSVSGSEKPEETGVNYDPDAEAPKKQHRKRSHQLSPEEQAQVDRNIADQTSGLKPEDYERAYKELLKPLWARGHNFTPRNIDEVKTLMSQGVDYLYKTQQLAQYRKQVDLLRKENITDADLTFMIDLKKKDPEAIKKFFADNNINPYDIDTTSAVNYQPKTHMTDDASLQLQDSVRNLMDLPDGRACYNSLVHDLDKQSQDYFLKEPGLLNTFYQHQHISVGNNKSLYDMIKDEIDHAKALGQLPQNMPFLQAYRTVGDNLLSQVQGQAGNQNIQPSRNQVNSYASATAPEVHQRLGSIKDRANVNDRVRSAGVSPKSKSARSGKSVNPFDMPDDEFLKQFEGRL